MRQRQKRSFEMNIFVRCAVVICIVASVVSAVRILMKYNDYLDKIEALSLKKAEYEERIEQIEYELGCEFDDEYIIRVAKEKLNLCMPDEVIYYNGLD